MESKDNKITTSSPIESKEKVDQDIEAKIKKDDDDKLNDDGKSEKNNESMSRPSSEQSKVKTKEVKDPLTDEEIPLTLAPELSSKAKSSPLTANLTEDQIKTCNTRKRVELKEKVQNATETKPREDSDNLPSDGISKETDKPLSQEAKAKVALDQKLTTSNEKPSSLACNRNEEDIVTSSEVKTSTNFSGVKHEEKNRHMGTEANLEHDPITRHENESVKSIGKASLLRAQQEPAKHRQLLQELKLEQAIHIASEPQDNSVGKHVDTIYKEEAVCKKCCKYMFDENIVLWAKCECKLALIHQKCASEWIDEKGSTCGVCGKEIENVSVTLSMDASTSSPQQSTADLHKKPTSVSKKWYRRLF